MLGAHWPIVLFDLDGTLTDPSPGIFASVRHALDQLGAGDRTDDELRDLVGPPLREGFAQLGVAPDQIASAVAHYRDRYDRGALFDAPLHDGIPDLLDALVGAGRRLAIATSKPWVFAERILQHAGLADHFEVVAGAELDGGRGTKAEVVAHALEGLGGADPDACVLVGDRRHDVEGATDNGVACIGVRWGFADPGELEAAGATHVVDTVPALQELLLDGPPVMGST